MKNLFFFVLTFLCLYFSSFSTFLLAQNSVLDQPITLTVQNQTLENIFITLSKKYNVRFSYSNSRLALQKRTSISVSNTPLKEVLTQIFEPFTNETTQIQFRLINGQIVIQAKSIETETILEKEEKPALTSIPKDPLIIVKTNKTENTATVSTKKDTPNNENEIELVEKNIIIDSLKIIEEVNNTENTEKNDLVKVDSVLIDKTDKTEGLNSLFKIDSLPNTILDTIPMQVTFIYPLGTNGHQSLYKANFLSINILAGYNGSLKGLEMGGIANILKKDAKGVQLAGFANVVGGKTKGLQLAGFGNFAKDSVIAFQGAGFININTTATNGLQTAGFMNLINGNLKGVQAAGFGNITKGNVDGAQISGFINIAKNVKGVQIGIINKADTVKGSLIGIINIADSVTGVPIGLINFVKNGYHSFEISGSEGFHTALAYNIGVNKFYQILSLGVQMGNQPRWGLGIGVGTRFPIAKKTFAGFELMHYHLNEKYWTTKFNSLSQFKLKLHYQISNKVGIFVAPSINVTVSQIYNAQNDTYGTNFAPYTFIDDTSTHTRNYSTQTTNVKIWGGGFIGISF